LLKQKKKKPLDFATQCNYLQMKKIKKNLPKKKEKTF